MQCIKEIFGNSTFRLLYICLFIYTAVYFEENEYTDILIQLLPNKYIHEYHLLEKPNRIILVLCSRVYVKPHTSVNIWHCIVCEHGGSISILTWPKCKWRIMMYLFCWCNVKLLGGHGMEFFCKTTAQIFVCCVSLPTFLWRGALKSS